MSEYIQFLLYAVIAVFLFWFGYVLFFRLKPPPGRDSSRKQRNLQPRRASFSGVSQTCPVCSAQLTEGEQVKTAAFPSLNGSADRYMHVKGCYYCLNGKRERVCPVCGQILLEKEILICRMFEQRGHAHVRILGCSQCRGI